MANCCPRRGSTTKSPTAISERKRQSCPAQFPMTYGLLSGNVFSTAVRTASISASGERSGVPSQPTMAKPESSAALSNLPCRPPRTTHARTCAASVWSGRTRSVRVRTNGPAAKFLAIPGRSIDGPDLRYHRLGHDLHEAAHLPDLALDDFDDLARDVSQLA